MQQIDDLVAVLSNSRHELYPFERLISVFGFTAWLNNPEKELAPSVAMARAGSAILHFGRGPLGNKDAKESMVREFLTPDRLAAALLDARFERYEVAEDHLVPLAEIANFFLQCPSGIKPSINRAFHFITEGGADDMPKGSISRQTLNRIWSKFAHVSPFIVTTGYFEVDADFVYLAPDEVTDLTKANRLLLNGTIAAYFEGVHAVQNLLLDRFDPETKRKYEWVSFPKTLKARHLPDDFFPSYRKTQIEIIKAYKAKRPPG